MADAGREPRREGPSLAGDETRATRRRASSGAHPTDQAGHDDGDTLRDMDHVGAARSSSETGAPGAHAADRADRGEAASPSDRASDSSVEESPHPLSRRARRRIARRKRRCEELAKRLADRLRQSPACDRPPSPERKRARALVRKLRRVDWAHLGRHAEYARRLGVDADALIGALDALDRQLDKETGRALGDLSDKAKNTWGGIHAEPPCRRVSPSRKSRKIRRALERWIETEMVSLGEPTPRWDGAALIRELVSRRYQLSRARRQDEERKLVIIAVDVSGSCAMVAPAFMQAACELANVDDRIVVITHSNGWAAQYYPAARHAELPPVSAWGGGVGATLEWWTTLAPKVGLVLALGDSDAERQYRCVHEHGARVLWLDPYTSSVGRIRIVETSSRFTHMVGVSADRIFETLI